MLPVDGEPPVGMTGIFGSELGGEAISEAFWSVLPEHQGRGYASAALRILLDASCRKFGFELVGQQTVGYGGRSLCCNHWLLGVAPQ